MRIPLPRRPVTLTLTIALVFVVAGTVLQGFDRRLRDDASAANRALTDVDTTATVLGDVSNGLAKLFSYSPDNPGATEQAAAEVLGGKAASEYTTVFASQMKQNAVKQRLTLSTRVTRAGVVRLSGDTANLLVFLDQTIGRKDKAQPTSAAAQLAVTARLEGGHWRIVDIHAR